MGRYDGDKERLTAVAEDSLESSTQLSEEDSSNESSESSETSELLQPFTTPVEEYQNKAKDQEEQKSNFWFFKN